MWKKILALIKSDTDSRTAVFSAGMFFITLLFAVYNGLLGLHYMSLWHGSICIYYVLLSLIRVYILLSEKHIQKHGINMAQRRRNAFLVSSIILFVINISMIVPTILMVRFEKPMGMTLIPALVIAVYTTIKVILAIMQIKKRTESSNPLIRELWTINDVDAALSVISLQNTLIMVAGDPSDRNLFILSAVTSGIIIIATIVMEIFFFVKEMKRQLI